MRYLIRAMVALIILCITAPAILLAMILIWLETDGEVIFRQRRIGKGLKPFTVYKLRTMVAGPVNGKDYLFLDKELYTTRAGKALRMLRLDELPQLVNILKGEMTFIGPRPLRVKLHRYYLKHIDRFEDRYGVLPGIMGISQFMDPLDQNRAIGVAYDLQYIAHKSLKIDLLILLSTFVLIVSAAMKKIDLQFKVHWGNQLKKNGLSSDIHMRIEHSK